MCPLNTNSTISIVTENMRTIHRTIISLYGITFPSVYEKWKKKGNCNTDLYGLKSAKFKPLIYICISWSKWHNCLKIWLWSNKSLSVFFCFVGELSSMVSSSANQCWSRQYPDRGTHHIIRQICADLFVRLWINVGVSFWKSGCFFFVLNFILNGSNPACLAQRRYLGRTGQLGPC